ncbi:DNA primase large subunit [Cebus imitator]|nr:DNA primase large subunit [Cebus imitator]
MEFTGKLRRMQWLAGDQRSASYPHCLQFYLQPPSENISLIEFENLAIDRVKLLKSVENLGVSYVKGTDQYQSKLENELRKLKFSYRENLEDEYEPRRRDHISHFILRLAYCQSPYDLFPCFQLCLFLWDQLFGPAGISPNFRLCPADNLRHQARAVADLHCPWHPSVWCGSCGPWVAAGMSSDEALGNCGTVDKRCASYTSVSFKISDKEKTLREQEIIASSPNLNGVKSESIYKIPFADALDLFRGRKVYLEDGFAYVPLKDIVAIILNEFRAKLSKALALTARSLPAVQSDERLQPLLNHLSHSYTGQDYSTQGNAGKISLDQIDSEVNLLVHITRGQHSGSPHEYRARHLSREPRLGMYLTPQPSGMSRFSATISSNSSALNSLSADGHDHLPNVNPGHSALGLSKGTSHPCLEPIGEVQDEWVTLSPRSSSLQLKRPLDPCIFYGEPLHWRASKAATPAKTAAGAKPVVLVTFSPNQFDKGYSYNIRHSFGKEGKRTDYTPFSCLKIILSNPPSHGDYHGCPFRHSDPELLKQKLQSYKISSGGISQILDLVKGTHYQVACQKYFEMIHNVDDCGFSLNHPNQFFCESQRILNGGKDIKKEPIQPETSQPKPSIQKTKDASSALASLNSSMEMDIEGLEDYFNE